jgi:hypothetical protein
VSWVADEGVFVFDTADLVIAELLFRKSFIFGGVGAVEISRGLCSFVGSRYSQRSWFLAFVFRALHLAHNLPE